MNNINKVINDTTDSLIKVLNESGLPPAMLRVILKNLDYQLLDIERKIEEDTKPKEE